MIPRRRDVGRRLADLRNKSTFAKDSAEPEAKKRILRKRRVAVYMDKVMKDSRSFSVCCSTAVHYLRPSLK